MSIKFFNTLSNKLDEFKPLEKGRVGMYTCGPTVYDYAHIGNFRAFVFEDLLRRFLEASGYKVKHVMNLTDVDDKTIAGAKREGQALEDYTAKYIQSFNDDLKTLNCLAPHEQPRATQKIPEMQALIQKLIEKGVAYASEGSVYYRVAKFPGYGKLSKKKLEMNVVGASERVESDEYDSKEQASDFVLWKAAKEGEPSWDSPWGKGRPGWHIECSAMSMEELGEQFDIHAGGEDLIFPHHENEIAQSEGATGKDPFVKYWLHCKFLLVEGEKMSKSKGNFYTLRDLLAKGHDPMAIRCALLSTHYRSSLNFTFDGLKDAGELIRKLDECFWQCISRKGKPLHGNYDAGYEKNVLGGCLDEIKKWLSDDLNVSAAFADILDGVKVINTQLALRGDTEMSDTALDLALDFLRTIDKIFGFDVTAIQAIPQDVSRLMTERAEVRRQVAVDKSNKALWAKSDELRNQIQALGWIVKDGKPGESSTLKKKRRVWDV